MEKENILKIKAEVHYSNSSEEKMIDYELRSEAREFKMVHVNSKAKVIDSKVEFSVNISRETDGIALYKKDPIHIIYDAKVNVSDKNLSEDLSKIKEGSKIIIAGYETIQKNKNGVDELVINLSREIEFRHGWDHVVDPIGNLEIVEKMKNFKEKDGVEKEQSTEKKDVQFINKKVNNNLNNLNTTNMANINANNADENNTAKKDEKVTMEVVVIGKPFSKGEKTFFKVKNLDDESEYLNISIKNDSSLKTDLLEKSGTPLEITGYKNVSVVEKEDPNTGQTKEYENTYLNLTEDPKISKDRISVFQVAVVGSPQETKDRTKTFVPVKLTDPKVDKKDAFFSLSLDNNSKEYYFKDFMTDLQKAGNVLEVEGFSSVYKKKSVNKETGEEFDSVKKYIVPIKAPVLQEKSKAVSLNVAVVGEPFKSGDKTYYKVKNLEVNNEYMSISLKDDSHIKRDLLTKKGNEIEVTGYRKEAISKKEDPKTKEVKEWKNIYFNLSQDPKKAENKKVSVNVQVEVSGVGVDKDGSLHYPVKVLDKEKINHDYIGVTAGSNGEIETSLLGKKGKQLNIVGYLKSGSDDYKNQTSGEVVKKESDFFQLTESPKVAVVKKVANAVGKDQGVKI